WLPPARLRALRDGVAALLQPPPARAQGERLVRPAQPLRPVGTVGTRGNRASWGKAPGSAPPCAPPRHRLSNLVQRRNPQTHEAMGRIFEVRKATMFAR